MSWTSFWTKWTTLTTGEWAGLQGGAGPMGYPHWLGSDEWFPQAHSPGPDDWAQRAADR